MTVESALFAAALAFAFINGLNDGGSLMAVGLGVRSMPPLVGIGILTMAVVCTPLVLGTGVATTISSRLVGLEGGEGKLALLVAVAAAVIVVFALSRRGLPTSLTLGLIGAIAGVGVGTGLPVAWKVAGIVLVLAAVAPFVGLLGGWALSRAMALQPASSPLHVRLRRWHRLAFGAQCVAYGANDGQKMLAVVAVAAGSASGSVEPVPVHLAAIGALFMLGAAAGLPRFAETIGTGIVALQPPAAVFTQVSAASVVLGTAAVGSPVSMTQAISGALIGSSIHGGHGRVRWRAAGRIVGAWFITLPAAFLLAAGLAMVLQRLR